VIATLGFLATLILIRSRDSRAHVEMAKAETANAETANADVVAARA
jgi:hypothetical protein